MRAKALDRVSRDQAWYDINLIWTQTQMQAALFYYYHFFFFYIFMKKKLKYGAALGLWGGPAGRTGPGAQERPVSHRVKHEETDITLWCKYQTGRRNDLGLDRQKISAFVLNMVISRLFPGVQAGRKDDQICSRCGAARARRPHPLTRTHTCTHTDKGGENTRKQRLLLPQTTTKLVWAQPEKGYVSKSWYLQMVALNCW